ncbi:unnamed protein product [Phytophthora lilii]|uniref:Unnamed protein product n=1 Tax=Phytophthora lilii TaxID=2077276 RepID=A0A9W6UAD9_9STRA|nr:unnamed protein product [Phytophthora lilii]
MRRCRSLPTFGNKFFESVRAEEESRLMIEDVWTVGTVGADIDFELIKRCQHPQYESQIRLYHRYRLWKALVGAEAPAPGSPELRRSSSKRHKVHSRKSSLRLKMQVINSLPRVSGRFDSHASEPVDPQLVFQRSLRAELCFPHELTELSATTLRTWAGFEVFIMYYPSWDIANKINEASFVGRSEDTKAARSKRRSLRHVLATNLGLVVDIVAVLPLELLLLAGNVRVSLEDEVATEIDLNWWTYMMDFENDRMLFAWRIEPLSEGILQYIIHDCVVDVSEPLVSFLRALKSYLTMAHFLACLWFATSDYGLHRFGTSRLSTSGMPTYIPSVATTSHRERTRRALSETTSDNFLEGRNRALMVEIAITLWAIYIYGALVGAQGKLLDSSARREASFEQNLGELQLYLVQNDVPKILKRQIKAYYAHIVTPLAQRQRLCRD